MSILLFTREKKAESRTFRIDDAKTVGYITYTKLFLGSVQQRIH